MAKIKILIVEDESIVALSIQRKLQHLGYEISEVVVSGEEAIEQAEKTQPNIVLMDIMLAGEMDGIQAAGHIRDNFDIPVIYLTANADESTLQRAKITEPFGYLLKPFEDRDLHTTIEMALYKHKMEQKLRRYRDHLEELVQERTAQLAETNEHLQAEIIKRKQMEKQILHNAFHDVLTGLPNRALLIDHLKRSIGHARRNKNYLFAVLILDLDRFKMINDSMGHSAGDELLMTIAQRLKASVRQGDTIARFGADEFIVLLDDIEDMHEVITIADQLQRTVTTPIDLNGTKVVITVSIGIVFSKNNLSDANGTQPEDILRDAGVALHQAKARGRNRYEFFDIGLHARAVATLALETDLRQAVAQQAFEIYYQPIISLANGQISRVEALLRWQHPRFGHISPGEFIPLLEDTGLIAQVNEWMLREVCTQIKNWHQAGHIGLRGAVNISVRQFQEKNLPALVKTILQETNLSSAALELEVTESIAMQSGDFSLDILNELNAIGINISIDDFGTGYSSLNRLKRMPVNTLKIDQSFVKEMVDNIDDRTIIAAIVAMAHSLNLKAIAEGVETEEQLHFLQTQKCDEIQGYLFSQALPPDDLTKLLRENPTYPL